MKTPYTENEKIIQEALLLAWNTFTKLESTHPDEKEDFKRGIHACQYCLAMRTIRRDYPSEYPSYDKEGKKLE